MFTASCLVPMVPLAGYWEVSIKYSLGAGSLLFNKNRAVNLPAAAMNLFIVVSLGIQLQHRDGSELCMDGHWKTKWVKALLLLQHRWALLFQASSKGQFARGHAEQWSNGTGVEGSAEHSPASGVACVLPRSLLYWNYNEQFIFRQTKYRRMSGFLPSPWFPVIQRRKLNRDETGMRTVPASFKVSHKGRPSLEVRLPLRSKPWVPHTAPTRLAALGSLGDRNGKMDVRQTHTAAYVWLPVGWHETCNLMQSMGAKPVQ